VGKGDDLNMKLYRSYHGMYEGFRKYHDEQMKDPLYAKAWYKMKLRDARKACRQSKNQKKRNVFIAFFKKE